MGHIRAVVRMGLLRAVGSMGLLRAVGSMGLVRAEGSTGRTVRGPKLDRNMDHKRAKIGTVRLWAQTIMGR